MPKRVGGHPLGQAMLLAPLDECTDRSLLDGDDDAIPVNMFVGLALSFFPGKRYCHGSCLSPLPNFFRSDSFIEAP